MHFHATDDEFAVKGDTLLIPLADRLRAELKRPRTLSNHSIRPKFESGRDVVLSAPLTHKSTEHFNGQKGRPERRKWTK